MIPITQLEIVARQHLTRCAACRGTGSCEKGRTIARKLEEEEEKLLAWLRSSN